MRGRGRDRSGVRVRSACGRWVYSLFQRGVGRCFRGVLVVFMACFLDPDRSGELVRTKDFYGGLRVFECLVGDFFSLFLEKT